MRQNVLTPGPPLVTIVTPSYNYGEFLGDCLESVRSQSYPLIQHLVIDGGSKDETAAVVSSFSGSYDLCALFAEDGGQADALNKGFALARGEIFCWLNADDYWLHEGVISEAVDVLLAGADLVTGGGWYVDRFGRQETTIKPCPKRVLTELSYHDTFLQPATFWRRSVHRRIDSSLQYAFDWQLFLTMKGGGAKIEVVDKEWAAYRAHGSSKTMLDPARRKLEVANVLRGEWGRWSPQYAWARAVFRGYQAAEILRIPFLKRMTNRLNTGMRILTRHRIYSC